MNELLPCPFGCVDEPPSIVPGDCRDTFKVECEFCAISGPTGDGEEEAVQLWNNRNNSDSIQYQSGYLNGIKDAKNALAELLNNKTEGTK